MSCTSSSLGLMPLVIKRVTAKLTVHWLTYALLNANINSLVEMWPSWLWSKSLKAALYFSTSSGLSDNLGLSSPFVKVLPPRMFAVLPRRLAIPPPGAGPAAVQNENEIFIKWEIHLCTWCWRGQFFLIFIFFFFHVYNCFICGSERITFIFCHCFVRIN